jgi:flagellar biosynthesis protein FlhG
MALPASASDAAQAPDAPPAPPRPPVWALAGGKGGVGRTLLTANLGIQLARGGHRVVVVDLDLQGGNLAGFLGFPRLERGLAQYATDATSRLADLAFDTSINHLRLIGGLQRGLPPPDPIDLVNRIGSDLGALEADFVILDCGSGRSPGTLAAFSLATLGIVTSTPEPAALESACLFIEAHTRRCFERALPEDTRHALAELLRADGVEPQRVPFRVLMTRLGGLDPSALETVAQLVRRTRLELLLNMVRDEDDEAAGATLVTGFRKCFGLDLPTAGMVEYDPSVLQSIHKRRPLSQQFPNTLATKGIARATHRLLQTCAPSSPEPREEWQDLREVDHYRVLEIVPKASTKEVQSAYQILKRAYDPETTHLSPFLELEGLRSIQARVEEAYRALIFLESRVAYDRQLVESGTLGADQIRGLHGTVGAQESGLASGPGVAARPRPAAEDDDASAPASGESQAASSPDPSAASTSDGAAAAAAASGAAGSAPPSASAEPAPQAAGPDADTGIRPAPGSGAALRAARLRLGLTLEAIAERTKIRRTYLQAIEEDRYPDLPPPVFLRGFVREFAGCLGLPVDEAARAFLAARQKATAPEPSGPEGPQGRGPEKA